MTDMYSSSSLLHTRTLRPSTTVVRWLLLFVILAGLLPAFAQTVSNPSLYDYIRVAAGSTAATRDVEGKYWQADYGFTGGAAVTVSNNIANTSAQALYRTARQGVSKYEFRVPAGRYAVSLKFAETVVDGPGQRTFDVTANGLPVLSSFDIFAAAGNRKFAAVDRNFIVDAPSGQVAISFMPRAGQALVTAIEILPIAKANPVNITLKPATATMGPNQTLQYTAKITNTINFGVIYTIEPAIGSIDSNGYYRTPNSIDAPVTVTLTATSTADPTKKSSSTIQLVPKGTTGVTLGGETSVVASPWMIGLGPNQSKGLTGVTLGGVSRSVTWSLSPEFGTISSSGVYRAPAVVSKPTYVVARATSVADPDKSDTVLILVKPPITVDIAPASASIGPGGKIDYNCTLTGAEDPKVIWTITPEFGTIDADGVYTAPSVVTVSTRVTIRAYAQEDPYYNSYATVLVSPTTSSGTTPPPSTATPTVSVGLSPSSVTLQAGKSQSFLVAVNGTTNTGVVWSMSPAFGTLSASGVYSAPATVSAPTTVVVRATSLADSKAFGEAAISVIPGVVMSMTPSFVQLGLAKTQQFVATVTGSANTSVMWTLSPALGTITAGGLYTSPAALAAPTTVIVRATSVADTTKSVTATVSLDPGITVTVSPDTVTLNPGQSRQFTASVANSTNTSVIWTMSPAVGTLTAGGLYTAPAAIAAPTNVVIKATSQADPTAFDTSTVTLTPPVTISLTPATATVGAGKTQQFTATVTGSTSPLTWTATAGTVSSTGLYTAPASVASATTVTVKAALSTDATKSGTATVTVNPDIQVTLSPLTPSIQAGRTQQFTASVTGTTNTAVIWSVTPATGSISAGGLYTAPATVSSATTVTVKAASQADPTKSATTTLTVTPAVAVTLTSSRTSLEASQTATLTAAVTGTTNTTIAWSMNPSTLGTLSTSGLTAVYTAPATNTTQQTVEITATSMADSTKLAKVILTLLPTISLSVSPAEVTVSAGQKIQFTAAENGVPTTAVTWSLDQPEGTIQSSGLYTAPSSIPLNKKIYAKATSTKDISKSAIASINLSSAAGISYTLDANDGLSKLSYNGVDYTWKIGFVTYEYWTPPGGEEGAMTPSSRVSASIINNGTSVLHKYRRDASHEWDMQVDYSGVGTNTLGVSITITNRATSDTLRPYITPLSWRLPSAPTTAPAHIVWNWDLSNQLPGGSLSYGSNTIVWWNEPANANIEPFTEYPTAGQQNFKIEFRYQFKNGPAVFREVIKPGETRTWALKLRFGAAGQTKETLAPEIISNYRSAFPYLVNMPDRRPIARITVSNPNTNRSECTAQNPRCYMLHKNPLGDPAGFRQSMINFANSTLGVFNQMINRPQGIIIWDIEGQEFMHPFSYVGDPANLKNYAPEMDAVADEFIGKFRNAGYKIGFALRPQRVAFGTTLPSTCIANNNANLRDVFVKLDAPFPYRGYICNSPNTWVQEGAFRPAAQTDPRSYEQLLAWMRDKVSYARSRWGATLFYVDSNGWSLDGARMTSKLWRDLAVEFPDVVFFPEHRTYSSYGAASAYNGDQPLQIYETEPQPNLIWQNKPFTLTVADVKSTDDFQKFVNAVRRGDILLFDGWFMWKGVTDADSIYQAAK